MQLRIVFLLSLLIVPVAVGSTAHCSITIRQKTHRGQNEMIRFQSALRSRTECFTLAKMHNKNFEPRRYRAKRVSYVWTGPEAPRHKKTQPPKMLSRRERPARDARRRR